MDTAPAAKAMRHQNIPVAARSVSRGHRGLVRRDMTRRLTPITIASFHASAGVRGTGPSRQRQAK
jgi:hypothetical protein